MRRKDEKRCEICADISLEISAIRCEIKQKMRKMENRKNRNKCADISLEISAIRIEI